MDVFDYCLQLQNVSDIEEFHQVCDFFCRDNGFDFFLYGATAPSPLSPPHLTVVTNYPIDWCQRYRDLGYFSIDPVVAQCSRVLTPVFWRDAPSETKAAADFMEEARSYGLGAGVTVPVHSGAGPMALVSIACAVNSDEAYAKLRQRVAAIHLFAAQSHEVMSRVLQFNNANTCGRMSERERVCLTWAAEGKTSWEIGKILGLSEKTVVYHLNNACNKLGASNRQHAIARAVSLGEIRPDPAIYSELQECSSPYVFQVCNAMK